MPYVHARSYKRQVIEKKIRGPRKGTAISAAKKNRGEGQDGMGGGGS